MKISLWFTHPRGVLGVYDFLLSDKSNRSYIKGVIGCDISYKLFELKYMLAVCVHNHPIMIKIHPVFFFYHFPFLKPSRSQMPVCDVTQTRRHTDPGPSHDCWLTLAFYLRPALSELSSVCDCFDAGIKAACSESMPFLLEKYPYFKRNKHFSLTSGICHTRKPFRRMT